MLPYVTSYLRNATGDTSVSYTSVVWADNCSWIVTYAGIAFLGLLEQRLPRRVFFFIGIASFAVSYVGSYWAVQTSVAAFVAVFGIFQGVAQAILWPSAVNVALRWFPERKHVVGGIVMAGYGAGGLGFVYIWNYWKAFGQTFIRDDHFLALVGSCAGIFGAAGRPLWGWLAERIGSLMDKTGFH
nr:hypothetical protein BaRGS_021163 [Batillaria attramentaria]